MFDSTTMAVCVQTGHVQQGRRRSTALDDVVNTACPQGGPGTAILHLCCRTLSRYSVLVVVPRTTPHSKFKTPLVPVLAKVEVHCTSGATAAALHLAALHVRPSLRTAWLASAVSGAAHSLQLSWTVHGMGCPWTSTAPRAACPP